MAPDAIFSNVQRNPGIPIEYLVAEIVAFPLASMSAFENPVTGFDPGMDAATSRLWRKAESHILQVVPDLSIDQALAIRDQFWFGKVADPGREYDFTARRMLHDYLRRVANAFLEVRGATAVPKVMGGDQQLEREKEVAPVSRRNNTLRWFSFSLPVDLLMGALNGRNGLPKKIDYLAPQLFENLRKRGFAENHLHVGAALEFPEFWVTTLHRLKDDAVKNKAFVSPGAEMEEGLFFSKWLLRAALARSILACFLFYPEYKRGLFSQWLAQVAYRNVRDRRGRAVLEILRRGLVELETGGFIPYDSLVMEPSLRQCYRDFASGETLQPLREMPQEIHLADPIASLTGYTPDRSPAPELCFVSRALEYLDQAAGGQPDSLFASLFWQVMRIRCLYYRHVTQRPMTPGLIWFVRHYDRMGPGRESVNTTLLVRSAAETCGIEDGLKALEVRKSPKECVSTMLKMVDDGAAAFRSPYKMPGQTGREGSDSLLSASKKKLYNEMEFGWVFHFEKTRGNDSFQGRDKPGWSDTEADPYPRLSTGAAQYFRNRYAHYYRKMRTRAMALGRLVLEFPNSLKFIRGVDLCTDELGIPIWVLAPCLRYVRDAGKAASRYLQYSIGDSVEPMRLTVHTGEDYVHLLGGIRRVEEAVRYLNLGPGDRIGHGIALGTDPESWAWKTGRISMIREERLLDLVWEWSQYSTHDIENTKGRMAYVEREIARLSCNIFLKSVAPYTLEKFVGHLHSENALRDVRYPDCSIVRVSTLQESEMNEYDLLRCYLTDPEVFKRGHEIEWINVRPEIESMMVLQNYVRKRMAALGIVVEVNPTSNLLIGNLTDLKNHPFWRLNPPVGTGDPPPVSICIGSDDPLTFATNLRREYALLYESLVDGGLSASQAGDWLEKIRAMGWNSRFTLKLKEPRELSQEDRLDVGSYRITDSELPRYYQVVGLDRYVVGMP